MQSHCNHCRRTLGNFQSWFIYLSHAATCKSMRMSRMCEMLQYISLRRSLAATLQADETADAMPTNADKCTKPTAFTSHSAASSDNKEVCASLHYDYTYLYFIYGFFPAELHVKILSWFAEWIVVTAVRNWIPFLSLFLILGISQLQRFLHWQ